MESITIYTQILILERKKDYNRYMISISDKVKNLFHISFFNGNIKQAKQYANKCLKQVKKEFKYNEIDKTMRCYK